MVKFNFRWLVIPCVLWAIWKFFTAVVMLIDTWNSPDLGWIIGIGIAIQSSVHILVALGLSFLIWRVFK